LILQKILYSLTISFLLIVLTACSNSKQNTQTTTLPSWYLNAPNNTIEKLYGTGEAFSLNEAKTNALSNMSQNLIVSVDSSINTKTEINNNNYNKTIIRDIKLKSKKIDFTNYKVEKAIQSGVNYFVLVSVNKNELFYQKKKELDLLDNKIELSINNTNNSSKLEKIKILENLKPTINKAKDLAFIIYAINSGFNYQEYYKKYDDYLNQIDILKSNLKIKVISNTSNTNYKEFLKELLTQENYTISNSNEDVLIKLNNNIRYSTAMGWQIVKATTTINTISNNKILSTNTISTIGRSSTSKKNALQSSANVFKKKVQKIGINKILYQ
jgi:hypothetical protein